MDTYSAKKRSSSVFIFCATLIEYIEFSIYIYLSPILSQLFFPQNNPHTAILLTYGIFAISYFVRPLGGIIFGNIADKVGRKNVLLFSVLLMSISTLAIGLLPTYQHIGALAPILLLVCRIFQSFAVAVEFNTSSMYLIELADHNPYLASSWLTTASCGGMGLGALIVSFTSFHQYHQGWRLPFLITGCLSFLIYLLRRKLPESPVFLQMQQEQQVAENPLQLSMKKYKRELVVIGLLAGYVGVFLYIGHVYFTTFLVQIGGYSLSQATSIGAITELSIAVLTPCFALLLQRCSPAKILKVGILLMALIGPWLFQAGLEERYSQSFIASVLSYVFADAIVSCCIFYYIYSLVPPSVRCTSLGIAWSICLSLIGGTAPVLAAFFVRQGWTMAPGIYMSAVGVVTFLGLVWYEKDRGISAGTSLVRLKKGD
jgi:MHS family proline/betaine transporter-like MFS transporter